MNEQQPYEKHLAEKMQHLPPPADMNQSWEQMRSLLDKEMPRGGGGGMPGGKRWWVLGLAVGILFLATWLSGDHARDKKVPGTEIAGTAQQPASEEKKAVLPGKTDGPAAAPSSSAEEGHADPGAPEQPVANAPAANDNSPEKSRGEPVLSANKDVTSHPERAVTKNNKNDHLKPVDETIITPETNRTSKNKNTIKGRNTIPGKEVVVSRKGKSTGNRLPNNRPRRELAAGKTPSVTGNKQKNTKDRNTPLTGNDLSYSKPAEERVRPSKVQALPRYINTRPEPVLHPGPQMQKDYAARSGLLPQRPAANASAAKKKVTKSREAGTFAVGFSLPLAFPLGDQRAMGYNYRGGHNTISDYLPSPHLQYHLNGNTFLQTEAQFISPQFIPSILLYNRMSSPMTTGGYYTSTSIFAKKLYYFNLPLSIHYSPFPGFYLGSGLQFSSLISGIALTEERKWQGGGPVYVKEQYSRFRKDTLSDRINGNEFRLLLDANYYWSKFTVGLRYNQALTNYISFQVSPSMPYSFNKNRGLQFYLRYNLWEEKKKPANNKTLLTFK